MAYGDNQIDGYGDEGPGVIFHYQRGSFREKENQATRDIADAITSRKNGFFKTLVKTRANRTLLIMLLVTMGVLLVVSFFSRGVDESVVDSMHCSLSAFSFEGSVYVTLKLEPQKKNQSNKNAPLQTVFDVQFSAINTDNAVADRNETQILCTQGQEESYARTVFADYDIIQVLCTVTGQSGESADLSTSVTKR
ncbi:MAG: hypothetical protein IIT68_05880 [Treponema sp.]|nr:hypothetical protein [Treponema sp.]